jgi:hypothetical protein
VRWRIGAGSTCEDAGLSTVRISLEESGGETLGPFDASCDVGLSQPFVIKDVDTGDYFVDLSGLDEDDLVRYSGRSDDRVSVQEGKLSSPSTIILSPVQATIQIQWRFTDGLNCASHGVTSVHAEAFLNDRREAEGDADCELEPNIVLSDLGEGTYDVVVTAVSDTGDPVYGFTEHDLELAAGQLAPLIADLESCDDIAGGC